jgi:hypothetical protein
MGEAQRKQQMAINVDVNTLQSVKCVCGAEVFTPVSQFKVLPRLYSNSGQPQLVNVMGIQCTACGHSMSMEVALQSALKQEKPLIT